MAKILVIDDEQSIVNLITAYLKPEGYEFHTVMDGPSGLKAARAFKPDLVILDIMVPGMDGLELLSRLRRESEVYLILITARTEDTDKIVGLSVGADDYVTKPFSPRELTARVKAALRRIQVGAGAMSDASVFAFHHLRMDTGARTVSVDEQPELEARLAPVRGNRMARAVLENALLDWTAKRRGLPLCELLGFAPRPIPSGISLGIQDSPAALVAAVAEAVAAGYHRVKVKIQRGRDVEYVRAVRLNGSPICP